MEKTYKISPSPTYHRALADLFDYPDVNDAPWQIIFNCMASAIEESERLRFENSRLQDLLREKHTGLTES
jgi:hypothetical protein